MRKFGLMILVAIVLSFAFISGVDAQAVPLPFRIGGSVTIDGVQITQATDDWIGDYGNKDRWFKLYRF